MLQNIIMYNVFWRDFARQEEQENKDVLFTSIKNEIQKRKKE